MTHPFDSHIPAGWKTSLRLCFPISFHDVCRHPWGGLRISSVSSHVCTIQSPNRARTLITHYPHTCTQITIYSSVNTQSDCLCEGVCGHESNWECLHCEFLIFSCNRLLYRNDLSHKDLFYVSFPLSSVSLSRPSIEVSITRALGSVLT